MADILIRLVAGDDGEESFFLSREFASDVARLSGVVSRTPPAAGAKRAIRSPWGPSSSPLFQAAGVLTALVSTIGSYLARDRRTEVEVATPDGHKVRISSQAFNHTELEELLRRSLPITGE
jgi:hypothetical protein